MPKISSSTLVHPILFSIFPIIFLYSHNVHIVPIRGFIIPLILSIVLTLLLLIVLRYVLKNKPKSALIVSLFVFLSLTFGHFKNMITNYETVSEVTDILILALFGILVVGGSFFFIKTKRKLDKATIITNSIAAVLVVMVLVNIVTYNFESTLSDQSNDYPDEQNIGALGTQSNPDVYLLMLDGYANQLILEKFFNYDNGEFINSLEEQGFFVSKDYSSSNYPFTDMSVPSFLNMDYVDGFFPSDIPNTQKVDLLYKAIDNNIVMQNFKALGYRNISFDSGWFGTRVIDVADQNLCENPNIDWRALLQLKEATILPALKDLNKIIHEQINDQKRQQILCSFSELPQITEEIEEPVFVFMHVVAPHPPWVFDSNGNPPVEFVDEKSKDITKRKMAYLNQMEYINKKVIDSIKEIISKSSSEPIIIILSDHGTRIVEEERTDEEVDIIKYGNFMAFYLPDDLDLLEYPTTPVNTFRIIFNSYFNGNYEILEDKVFLSTHKEFDNWEEKVFNVFG